MNNAKTNKSELPTMIVVSLLVTAVGFISGYMAPGMFTRAVAPALEKLKKMADQPSMHQSVLHVITVIFWNNLEVAFLMVVLGICAGIFPVLTMWFNGVVIGFVSEAGAQHLHVAGWKVFVYAMMPHGIFEMAALIWASALGLQLGYIGVRTCIHAIRQRVTGKPAETAGQWRRGIRRAVFHFPGIILLLLIAATIEGAVTPHIIQSMLPTGQ